MYIIDSTFVLNLLLPDEQSKEVTELFQHYQKGAVDLASSNLLPFEVINGIKSAIKSKRIEKSLAFNLVEQFLSVDIIFFEIDFKEVLDFALTKDLSVYDASYVWLAYHKDAPLLTLDTNLKTYQKKLIDLTS